jgi:hypothetical protein
MRQQLPSETPTNTKRAVREALALLLFSAPLLAARPAFADAKSCARAYEDGQRLRTSAQLTEAADKFLYCAGPECPELMHPDCQRRLDEVEAAVPSVVVRVEPSSELRISVSLDQGEVRPIDGQALRLNPGAHEVHVTAVGYRPATRRFMVSEGEKLKPLDITLAPLAEQSRVTPEPHGKGDANSSLAPARPRTTSWVPWAITSGVVAAGSAGLLYWGLRGRGAERDLADCSPDCSSERVDDVKRDYLLANVSLGVGLSGAAAMAVWYFVRPSAPTPRARVAGSRSPRLDLQVGSSVGLRLRF